MPVSEQITNFIVSEFLPNSTASALPDDLDLVAVGIVDSLGLLKVVSFVQEVLGVSIPPESMTPENFSSVGAIVRLLDALPAEMA